MYVRTRVFRVQSWLSRSTCSRECCTRNTLILTCPHKHFVDYIGNGIERKFIQMKENSIFVNGKKHCSVNDEVLVRNEIIQEVQTDNSEVTPTPVSNLPSSHSSPIHSSSPPSQSSLNYSLHSPHSSHQDHSAWLDQFNIALWNAHSVVSKTHFIQSLTIAKDIDLFCITETWLTDLIYD